jgi:hypothetical protein
LSQSSFSQKKADVLEPAENANTSPTNLAMAKYQINDIKSRGVIVRIKTNKDKIEAYRKAGNTKVANQIADKAEVNQLLLEMAFISKWTYCPVYFMESQHTLKLMKQDTLIAKTYDLLRDTAIYCPHDSFYMIDFGDLMANEPVSDNITYKNIHRTEQSSSQVGTDYLVVKDAAQQQLQSPFPYYSRIILAELAGYKYITPIEIPQDLADQISVMLKKYPGATEILKSDDKQVYNKYLSLIFNHIDAPGSNNAYQKAVARLNKRFITYYCSRLDKDKNILCNDDPYYWWQRNPNIRYIAALRGIESRLTRDSDKEEKFIKPR